MRIGDEQVADATEFAIARAGHAPSTANRGLDPSGREFGGGL